LLDSRGAGLYCRCKAALVKLLRRSDYGIFLNEHIEDEAAIVFQHASKLGLEGIVSKRRGSSFTWLGTMTEKIIPLSPNSTEMFTVDEPGIRN